MEGLSYERIILFHEKALKKFGGSDGVLNPDNVSNLERYVAMVAPKFGFDEIETICLAVYQIAKGHFFADGNKRTANYVLLNCLKLSGYAYTGRAIDLARKIEKLSQTPSEQKEEQIRMLAYFLKSRLGKKA